ncbi:hypothetical protein [Fundidesulfovibrio agrisoli]|uniref:hypothetical protein n=1 Tax=Fundidesulfovibrio agrisoli TaxID=2922717 RepID=UPI001FAE6E6F|nr:hypothetical protein [Fundidesulfovibrio agrisoli]
MKPYPAPPPRRKNRYALNAKVAETKLLALADAMAKGATASDASRSLKLNRNTVNRYYQLFRQALSKDVPESLRTVPSGAPVIGLFLTSTATHFRVLPDSQRDTALQIFRGSLDANMACLTPGWPGYDALGQPSTDTFQIMPCCLVSAAGQQRLKNSWSNIRARLCNFRGIPRQNYWQHLHVCELFDTLGQEELQQRLIQALLAAG